MKIIDINECGSSNILKWAIHNEADIKNDMSLQALINTDTFYQVRIEDVNMLELFRLSQLYRDKVHVIEEKRAEVPAVTELKKMFPGTITVEGEEASASDAAEHACNMFINLALQMNADDDVIRHESARLFLTMLSRHFVVDIPLSFTDFLATFRTPEVARILFNSNYPSNLHDVVISDETPVAGFEDDLAMVRNMIMLYIVKGTSVVKYDEHYEQLLRLVKYAPLRKCSNDKLYKFRMSAFSKYNNITRGESRCSMFNISKPLLAESIKKINSIDSPLHVDYVVQLPIHYMNMIENTYTAEELPIAYESSITSIVEGGLIFNDFVSPEFDESFEEDKIEQHKNSIELYKNRINEANQTTINSIALLLQNEGDLDVTATFALLPSIYTTKAVVTLKMEYASIYLSHYDPLVRTMFAEMIEMADSIK